HVVLACRNEAKGLDAAAKLDELLGTGPDRGSVQFLQLDVSDLKSVDRFTELFKQGHDRLDLLINNAGVMGGSYTLSVDGYERMFATNHLGHFALTAQLFHLLKQSAESRVVNVSSGLHKRGEASFNEDEIMVTSEHKFGQVQTYGETKLCNILFTIELDRRLKAAGIEKVTVVACHPGYVATNLGSNMAAANNSWFYWLVIKLLTFLPGGKSPEMGAMPTLYAATGNEVVGGDYIGPKNRNSGSPARHEPAELCKSKSAAEKLWALSEKLANVSFAVEK
ncbi:Retinol dehydrogenase, partial [Phytophthora palmivora]